MSVPKYIIIHFFCETQFKDQYNPSHKEDRHVTLFCLVISSLTLTNCWLFTQKRIMMMIWSVCLIYLRFLSISCASIYGKNCYRNFNTQKKIIESEVKNIFGTQSIPAKN